MRLGRVLRRLGCGLTVLGALYAFQRPFRPFNGVEYAIGDIPMPPDWQEKTEWAFARLMFPPGPLNGYRGRDLDWHVGVSLWTQDFPRADRHLALALRRPGGRMGPHRPAGPSASRVPAARRILHGR